MDAEIHENLKIGVGLIEQRPEAAHGHTLINTTWVYSTKLKDGEIVFKARLTARGDQEDPANINDDHRASPTADQDSIRLILAELVNMPGAKLMTPPTNDDNWFFYHSCLYVSMPLRGMRFI